MRHKILFFFITFLMAACESKMPKEHIQAESVYMLNDVATFLGNSSEDLRVKFGDPNSAKEFFGGDVEEWRYELLMQLPEGQNSLSSGSNPPRRTTAIFQITERDKVWKIVFIKVEGWFKSTPQSGWSYDPNWRNK